MSYNPTYQEIDQADTSQGMVLLEFGADWCPHCQDLQEPLRQALQAAPPFRHVKVQDGKGKPLGRAFQVKLWPNLVFLREGKVLQQLARPSLEELQKAVSAWTA